MIYPDLLASSSSVICSFTIGYTDIDTLCKTKKFSNYDHEAREVKHFDYRPIGTPSD